MKNNYRVFAFSEDVINIYNESKKKAMKKIANNFTPPFDTIIVFFNYNSKRTLELKFFRNGQELYSNYIHSYDFDNYPEFDFPIELSGTIQPIQKEEPLFRVGDRVYDWLHGWMVIEEVKSHGSIILKDDDYQEHTFNGNNIERLSVSEYNFITGGWSQERPKPLPKIGDIGWFWDDKMDIVRKCCSYGELSNIIEGVSKYVLNGARYRYFSTKKPFEK